MMNTIFAYKSFEEELRALLQELTGPTLERLDPRKVLKDFSTTPPACLPPAGARTRQVLFQNTQFELVLMRWGENSSSALHGHGGSQCYMRILSGELLETRYLPYTSSPVHESYLRRGQVTHINDGAAFHRLSSMAGAASLHLYATPLQSMQVFDEQLLEWRNKKIAEVS